MAKSLAVTRASTGTIVSEPCVLTAFGLRAGADAATAVLRDGGATGPIRWSLGAAATTSQGISFDSGLYFNENVHVTTTGTAPSAHVAVVMPQVRVREAI